MKFYTVCKQIAACAFSALLLAACFEDKGNYDDRDINEVTIEGIDTENVYQLYAYQSTLTINPVITSTIGDGQGYEYTWRIVPRQATEEDGTLDQYIVSHEKNLVYPVQLEDGDYTGFFEVKDPTTGVSWVQDFYLTVQSQGSEGWMALCDDNGKARLDLIGKNSEGEDVLFPDLWADNDLDIGAPQRLFFVAGMEEGIVERESLRSAIGSLPERERRVVLLRYYRGMTQEQTARLLGVSQVQVSRIERRTMERLRRKLEE